MTDTKFEFDITLSPEHMRQFQCHSLKGFRPRNTLLITILYLVMWALLIFSIIVLFNAPDSIHWPSVIVPSLFLAFGFLASVLIRHQKESFLLPSNESLTFSRRSYEINEDGVVIRERRYQDHLYWTAFKKAEKTKSLIILYTDRMEGLVFPLDQLDEPDRLLEFASAMSEKAKSR